MAFGRLLAVSLDSALVFAATIPEKENEAAAAEADKSQQQLSWQSAFWALVSIALCAATQPSGSIFGMPPEWGFALKCSPVMCILNSLESLACFRIQRQETGWKLAFRSTKYVKAPDPRLLGNSTSHQATGHADTNTALRLVSFILGPLMQAIKLFACSGILYTKLLAGCYLASFLCDELALNFIWLWKPEGHYRHSTPSSLVASTLSIFRPLRSQELEHVTPTDPVLASGTQKLLHIPAQLALDLSIKAISWFISSLVFVLFSIEPNLFLWIGFTGLFGLAPLCAIFVAVRRVRRGGVTTRVALNLAKRFSLSLTGLSTLYQVLESGPGIVSMDSPSPHLYAAGAPWRAWRAQAVGTELVAVAIGVAGLEYVDAWVSNLELPLERQLPQELYPSFVFAFFVQMAEDFVGFSLYRPGAPEPISRFWGISFPGTWCLLHFLTALLFHYSMFDPSQTFKPGWTEVLG
ncbi:uncharacterized protein PG998_002854 [Apiospora kogelbergensis]|uniref:uncharacterized protein n=1 Tax=Apiospora kogelbergensis TaxID=1337665 RepID=UPI00312DEE9B